MAKSVIQQIFAQVPWLDPIADAIQPVVSQAFEKGGEPGKMLKDLLNGVPLGHPLHAALTDVPIGAWTMAQMLDVIAIATGDDSLDKASDLLLGAGIVSGVGAAAAGITDWSDYHGTPRRIGMAHALLNTVALTLNLASLVLRKGGGSRGFARVLSGAGYGFVLASSALGGELSFGLGIGVNRNAWLEKPKKFRDAVDEEALATGKPVKADVDGTTVVLLKHDDGIHAFANTCPHAGGPLGDGEIDGHVVTCPWHGSQFDISTGKLIHGPATAPIPCFETRLRNGKIQVRLEQDAAAGS